MKSSEIRKKFVTFFETKQHLKMPSSAVVPQNDPTLLFTNSGMVQFKDIFTGKSNPPNKRVVTIQKSVRAGGKHNDLENVGFTARHHTFFEMLGNFSFRDYFKKEAISFAWEFLTRELKIPAEKLFITVHHSDQEAADIWHHQEGVPRERIFFRGDKDNFWEMGEVGPCGPCSEIFYDHGEKYSDKNANNSQCLLDDEGRYVEIWNLVFMQFEKYKQGGEVLRRPLPSPCVDTGAGLERIAAALQGCYNNFDTDGFQTIIKSIEKFSNKKYAENLNAMRVIADHVRASSMMLADGVIPSNEGRGYVLRRILRRATRFLELLDVKEACLYKLVPAVIETLGQEYVELVKNQTFIEKYLRIEEENFRKTLTSGLKLLEKEITRLKDAHKKTLEGNVVFNLYDTHGFPVDLVSLILAENKLGLDMAGFEKEMDEQRKRSKSGGDFSSQENNLKEFYTIKEKFGATSFVGYKEYSVKAKLVGIVQNANNAALVFNKTPFYAEGGGQAGDIGAIYLDDKKLIDITDTKKPVEDIFAHLCENAALFEIGREYELKINTHNRALIARNHTATHLLQAALIHVLGDHIKQSGSSVSASRLRFDFTQPEPVTKEQLTQVEELINNKIRESLSVKPENLNKDEAIKRGATALFGEKYGDTVRVITIGDFSIELCGGTHVVNISDIAYFKIVSESSLAAGIRRIEAMTSQGAFDFVNEKLDVLAKVETVLKAKGEMLFNKLASMQNEIESANKTIRDLKDKAQSAKSTELFENVKKVSTGVYKHIATDLDSDLKKLADLFVEKYSNGTVLLTSIDADKANVVLKTFKTNSTINCSNIIKDAFLKFEGRGGGKPDMAQGSVPAQNLAGLVEFIAQKIK